MPPIAAPSPEVVGLVVRDPVALISLEILQMHGSLSRAPSPSIDHGFIEDQGQAMVWVSPGSTIVSAFMPPPPLGF